MLLPDKNGMRVNLDLEDYHERAGEAWATIIDQAKGPSTKLQAHFQRPQNLRSPPHQRDSEYLLKYYGAVVSHMVFVNVIACFGIYQAEFGYSEL